MAVDRRQEREDLFNLYRCNLTLYDPARRDHFACPLCRRIFTRDALATEPPRLTLAHIISDSLHGRVWTLACDTCNNGNGAGLETHLLEQFRLEDWACGVGSIGARLRGPQCGAGVQLEMPSDGGLSVHIGARQTTQEGLRRIREGHAAGHRFEITFSVFNSDGRVRATVYQSAYLLLFRTFGYEAVGHPHFQTIREFIQEPEAGGFQPRIMVVSEESAAPYLAGSRQALVFLREPRAIAAFLRFQPRKGGRSRLLAALMPGLDSPEVPPVSPGRFSGAPVPYDPEALVSCRWYMHQLWSDYHELGWRLPA